MAYKTQEIALLPIIHLSWRCTLGAARWKQWVGVGMGVGQSFQALSGWGPSQHLCVFTDLEALPTPSYWIFDGGLTDQIIDHS